MQVKVPASGRALEVSHQSASYTVTEGNSVTVTATLAVPAGMAAIRETVSVRFDTATGGTTIFDEDYASFGTNLTIAPTD